MSKRSSGSRKRVGARVERVVRRERRRRRRWRDSGPPWEESGEEEEEGEGWSFGVPGVVAVAGESCRLRAALEWRPKFLPGPGVELESDSESK